MQKKSIILEMKEQTKKLIGKLARGYFAVKMWIGIITLVIAIVSFIGLVSYVVYTGIYNLIFIPKGLNQEFFFLICASGVAIFIAIIDTWMENRKNW